MITPDDVMRSPRLRFRALRADDCALIAPILQDAQTMYAWEHAFSHDEVCQWLATQICHYRDDGCGYLAAFDREAGELVALAGPLCETISGEREIGIGYIVNRRFWQQGYGVECARAALQYAFTALEAPRVFALIRPENTASLRVAERCGMIRTAICVKHYLDKEMPHVVYMLDNPTTGKPHESTAEQPSANN